MSLFDRVRRFVAQHDLAGRGTRVVVALSGGSDSVALAHIVRDLDAAGELRAAGLVHLNHQLRETAGRDEQFSVALAEAFGWRIVVERDDVAARARHERRSIEDAARTARYECFDRARATLAADVVALGHTRDDQAETFLLRLLRGAGPTGLAGIHPRHGPIVRPLLSCRRSELRHYLAARQIPYVEDETNADVTIPRNRVRAELLPLLEQRFNPAVVDVLADEAELARELWLWMEESLSAEAWSSPRMQAPSQSEAWSWSVAPPAGELPGDAATADTLAAGILTTDVPSADVRPAPAEGSSGDPANVILDVARLVTAPAAIRRFVVWRAMKTAAGRRSVSFAHVQAVLELLASDAPRSVDMPGHIVQRLGPRLVLTVRAAGERRRPRVVAPNFFDYPLSIPGRVLVSEAGCELSASPYPAGAIDAGALKGAPNAALVRRDLHTGPWRVRSRRPGDRFRPVGLGGRKKLQDFFVDRKVPRHRRDTVPLVVDECDRIVWVSGFGMDEAFRVTDPTQAVIMLQLKLLGGSA